jgi:hypothetical protein
MRKIILFISLILVAIACFSQEEKNGTIYIKHPYIDIVNKSAKAYLDKDVAANSAIFADTARFWASGMTKSMPIADAIKMWASDFDNYDSIDVKTFGYPDYLAYKDQDAKVVQSWWTWIGKSKKTGEVIKIRFVQFDDFNKDGKIGFESIYGDFSKMTKN